MRRTVKKTLRLELSVNAIELADEYGLDLEQIAANAIRHAVSERWKAENAEAIDAYNEFIEKHGMWSDGLRKF